MKHTPEPWFIAFGGNDGDDYAVIGAVGRERPICELGTLDYTKPNADRIAACVNACAGIADPADLRKQRDELLAALQAAVRDCREVLAGREPLTMELIHAIANGKARAAIANAEQTDGVFIQWGPATGGSAAAKYGRQLEPKEPPMPFNPRSKP